MDVLGALSKYSSMIEKYLDENLPKRGELLYGDVYDAMRYSLLSGGKRLRPALMLEFSRICGGDEKEVLPFACALECIHTYSLIHDDLPCMDDDDLRRGMPTLHKVYPEAIAVLTGDALLNFAFELCLDQSVKLGIDEGKALRAANILAASSGVSGMIGGQVIDIQRQGKDITYRELEILQSLKTGAIIKSACVVGCVLAGADDVKIKSAGVYAEKIGRAFQIRDDILDIEGDQKVFGKPIGSDAQNNKVTFPSILGIKESKELIESLTNEAIAVLDVFEDTEFLKDLSIYLTKRNK